MQALATEMNYSETTFVVAHESPSNDARVHRLTDCLLIHHARSPQARWSGGLARAAHRRVNELIHASLDDAAIAPPTLATLASAAGLSVNHFIRAFLQQMGVTPHRYIVLRRLERGIALLKSSGLSVAEVADRMGFATPPISSPPFVARWA